ncbi:hypothetical protein GOP47_0022147 [Adiantum capillus-veneris]|uniref:Pentatricopeptide repeat-containing protein n=1 Tax=Adiantum capillus-veneris TaxID=13818 RepID=A0A9D4U9E8_ADICA|nr:hypothetical protein GOP47_0022147 [Adiantum capillus-veneris]
MLERHEAMDFRCTSLGCRRQNILQTLDLLDEGRHEATSQILHNLLKECTKYKDLATGRKLSSFMAINGLTSDTCLNDHLIRMFAACGQLSDACEAFHKVLKPSIYTWNAIISAHSGLGRSAKTLELYHEMKQKGFQPDVVTFLCTLKACCDMRVTCQGMIIHNHIVISGLHSHSNVGNAVLDMYCKCGNLEEALKVFDTQENRTVVAWGALLAGYVQHGHGVQALKLFERMQVENIDPNLIIYSSTLKACSQTGQLIEGRLIHSYIIKSGLQSDIVVQNTLVDMYARCGSIEEAHTVFGGMSTHDVVSWGSLIAGYAVHGPSDIAFKLFHEMQQEGLQPCKATFLIMLKACVAGKATFRGRMLHDQIIRCGYELDTAVGNTVVDMYAKCGSLQEAHRVFDRLQDRNVVSWGALIAGYTAHGLGNIALQLFQEMYLKGVAVGISILTCMLKVCGDDNDYRHGRLVHTIITELGIQAESVENMLPDMYARCGNFEDAQSVFRMSERNVNVWASVLARCSERCNFDYAFSIFDMMWPKGKLTDVIYSSILKVCTSARNLQKGRLIHENIIRNRFDADVIIGNKLVDMYAKIGVIEDAHKVFSLLPNRDSISWGAIITGYVEHGLNVTALELYEKSGHERVEPTEATLLSVLKACGSLGAIEQGRLIHDQIIRDATRQDVAMGSTLLNMYAKCGRLQEARRVFDSLPRQDAIAWGALVAGYTWNGHIESALQAFKDMQLQSLAPDEVLFTNILAACSHTGLVQEGSFHFKSLIEKYDTLPGMEQVSCMIDILGRSGNLREAEDMCLAVPSFSDEVAQLSILTSCRTYQNMLH